MGMYLEHDMDGNPLPAVGKAKAILQHKYAVRMDSPPDEITKDPTGVAVICVVENGPFDAAGWCFDNSELRAFTNTQDRRKKTWIAVPMVYVKEYFKL